MSRFVMGDIHGCYAEFQEALKIIRFDPKLDHLYLTGDVLNRGMDSCGVLDWLLAHQACSSVVMGNHDIHLLAYTSHIEGVPFSYSYNDILAHKHCDQWLEMIKAWPLYLNVDQNFMIHASIHPSWDSKVMEQINQQLSKVISDDMKTFFKGYYDFLSGNRFIWLDDWNQQAEWSDFQLYMALFIFTKARYLKRTDQGYQYHAKKADHPSGLKDYGEWRPWYDEVTYGQGKVYFGHWAILAGQTGHSSCSSVDGGCVHGGHLLINNIDTGESFKVARFY